MGVTMDESPLDELWAFDTAAWYVCLYLCLHLCWHLCVRVRVSTQCLLLAMSSSGRQQHTHRHDGMIRNPYWDPGVDDAFVDHLT